MKLLVALIRLPVVSLQFAFVVPPPAVVPWVALGS